MKKMCILLVSVVTVMCVLVLAISISSQWETINMVEIKGGTCYAFTNQQCTGSTADCDSVYCTSTDGGQTWGCNVSTVTVKTCDTYNGACPTVESGGWSSCTSRKTECSQTKICTSCNKTIITEIYYCGPADTSVPHEVDDYYTEDPDSSC
jgi:hypothetical protein